MGKFVALIVCNRLEIRAETIEEAEKKYDLFFDNGKCDKEDCGGVSGCDCFDFDDSYCDHVWEGDI